MAEKKQDSATKRKLQAAFHEVKHNEPAIVAKTRKKEGAAAASAQKTAIALSKARAAGADIPEKKDHNPGNPGHQRPFAVSGSYDVYGGHAGDAASGVIQSQPEGPQGSQGRRPASQEVKQAQDAPGTAVKCAKQQTGENRFPINSHEADHKTHGPNN